MTIRLKAVTTDGEIRLMLPEGRHLERDGWHVAADIVAETDRRLATRVWAPTNKGYRVIVLDKYGAEYDSLRAPTYDQARKAMASLNGASVTRPKIDGRRLISGGDPDWEIAAEVRHVGERDLLFLRIWVQAKQAFAVYAVDAELRVRGHAVAATYRKACDQIVDYLLR